MRRFLLCCLILAWGQGSAEAFDTGHHKEMTIAALRREGFSDDAIRVIVLQNWLVDWYSAHGADKVSLNLARFVGSETPLWEIVQNHDDFVIVFESSYLHFDNLNKWQDAQANRGPSTDVHDYWKTLANSTEAAIHDRLRAKDPDVLSILTLLGISLHAVQDFYSHSNWVDAQSPANGAYDVTTWWDLENHLPLSRRVTDAFTGSYGKKAQGILHDDMNKDSYSATQWERAYVAAYWATIQWIRAFKAIVDHENADFWVKCLQGAQVLGKDSGVLDENLTWSYILSECTGKWKGGKENDDVFNIIGSAKDYRSQSSIFRAAFNQQYVYAPLSRDLGHKEIRKGLQPGLSPPQFSRVPSDEDAILLVIPQVKSLSAATFFDLRMFAKVRMSAGNITQEFVENTQFGNAGRKPFDWKVLFFVPKGTNAVQVRISLYNELSRSHERDQHIRIGDEGGYDLAFEFHPSDGTCVFHGNSVACGSSSKLESQGSSGHRANVKLYMERHSLVGPP
jgi:hypothetical protein